MTLMFNGMRIVVSEYCSMPRMQVTPKFAAMFPELAAETNAWMRGFFGVDDKIFITTDPLFGTKAMVISSRALAELELNTSQHAQVARDCGCATCRPITLDDMRMVLCPTCGNKRCPRAADHRNNCTNSNEPNQKGRKS